MTGPRCRGTTKAGQPCGMKPLRGSEWCWNHDPALADVRARARRKGGMSGRRARPSPLAGSVEIRTPEDALNLLTHAANETLELDNSVSRNRALAYIADRALRGVEVAELEERIRALEAVAVRQSQRSA